VIPTSKPFLPPLAAYVGYLEGIWDRVWLTNNGPLLLELEAALARFLGARYVVVTANGTLALQIAMRALDIQGEVICTPFTFVATASAPAWEGADVVLADVEPGTLTLDAAAVARALTPATRAILATHVYGVPCDDDALAALASRKDLRLIYDAAHAFGATYRGRSLCTFGDISVLSFHATKLFHTVEGGALVTEDESVAARARSLRNFGTLSTGGFGEPGTNAKCSEFHAAMGLALLPQVPELIARRAALSAEYDRALMGLAVDRLQSRPGAVSNHAYYPLLLPNERAVLRLQQALSGQDVQLRRYFYPCLNTLPYARAGALPVAEAASQRIVCLPLYPDLTPEQVRSIAGTVRQVM